jgi:3-methyladenine DNA glycosylase/8-oxoguanine DNA glycosylase
VLEALLPAIIEQKVTGAEASRAFRGLVRVYGEDAPGPPGLRLQPAPDVVASLPYHAFHPLGLERRRAELVRAVCREAVRLERLGDAAAGPEATSDNRAKAYAALRAFPGIGPWTAAEVGLRAFGDPDAVSVGDFHLPNMVAWAMAGESRGTDERMLELLEPYRGQRGRVIRLLELAGFAAPRYGPRCPPRRIEGI